MRLYPLLTLHLSSSLTLTSTFLTGFKTLHEPGNPPLWPCHLFRKKSWDCTLGTDANRDVNSYNVPVFSKNGERPTYYPGYHQTDITRIKA